MPQTLSPYLPTVNAAVAAGTNAQGQGLLTSDVSIITTNASPPGGVTLPAGVAGRHLVVANKTTSSIFVYPPTGGQIDGRAVNASIPLPAGSWLDFDFAAGVWISGGVIGYAKGLGAGGTVVQATSRTTGVTLSKATGQITLIAATLASLAGTSFLLTNSLIELGDHLVVSLVSGASSPIYALGATCGAGSASITIRNISGAISASESPVIGFALIKGATS